MSAPLSLDEQAQVRAWQQQLGAVKRCARCGQVQALSAFGRYGMRLCASCRGCERRAPLIGRMAA